MKNVGDPAENAAVYSEAGADELVFLDITATVENRKTLIDAVKRTIERIAIPLTVGGGIRNIQNIQELLDVGVSKASINTAAVRNPEFVREAVKEFGSEAVVIAIDTRSSSEVASGFEVMVEGGRTPVGIDAVEWAEKVEDLGAGEIPLTSMDRDGTKIGYDVALTKRISEAVSIPVIASGGCGSLEHLSEAFLEGRADAALAASIFHYGEYTIQQTKEYLKEKGIPVRI